MLWLLVSQSSPYLSTIDAAIKEGTEKAQIKSLKKEQREAVACFLDKDTFIGLPTGYVCNSAIGICIIDEAKMETGTAAFCQLQKQHLDTYTQMRKWRARVASGQLQ